MQDPEPQVRIIRRGGKSVAVLHGGAPVLTDAGAALEFAVSQWYENGCNRLAVGKEALPEDFFRLRTGLAGELLQKLVDYRFKIAVFGDLSGYTSKPLQDFIRESNRGRDVFFAADEEQAVEMLLAGPDAG